MDQFVPALRYNPETDTVEVLGEGSRLAEAHRASTVTDAPVSGIAPESGINAIEQRLAFLAERQKPSHIGPDGRPVYPLSAEQRAKFASEEAHLRNVVLPFQLQRSEAVAAEQAANLAERDARLALEASHREEIERRAAELVMQREAEKLAKRISADLKL